MACRSAVQAAGRYGLSDSTDFSGVLEFLTGLSKHKSKGERVCLR